MVAVLLIATALLGACNGDSSASGGGSATDTTPTPGQLLQTPPQLLTTITAAQMLLQLTGASNQQIQQVLEFRSTNLDGNAWMAGALVNSKRVKSLYGFPIGGIDRELDF